MSKNSPKQNYETLMGWLSTRKFQQQKTENPTRLESYKNKGVV